MRGTGYIAGFPWDDMTLREGPEVDQSGSAILPAITPMRKNTNRKPPRRAPAFVTMDIEWRSKSCALFPFLERTPSGSGGDLRSIRRMGA